MLLLFDMNIFYSLGPEECGNGRGLGTLTCRSAFCDGYLVPVEEKTREAFPNNERNGKIEYVLPP